MLGKGNDKPRKKKKKKRQNKIFIILLTNHFYVKILKSIYIKVLSRFPRSAFTWYLLKKSFFFIIIFIKFIIFVKKKTLEILEL